MHKNLIYLGLILVILIGAILIIGSMRNLNKNEVNISGRAIYDEKIIKDAIQSKFSKLQEIYREKKAQGYDLSKAGYYGKKAKQAYDEGDYEEANRFLNEAFTALEKAEIPATPSSKPTNLSQVKVASLYERVTDGKLINRSVGDVIKILKETKTDFIFRGWWIWLPCYNSYSEVPPIVESAYPYGCEEQGYSYDHLEDAISEIKKEIPDVIFCGAIPAQRINYVEFNPITDHNYTYSEIEAMALDPAKFGITSISKDELQQQLQNGGYFPDITNPDFQELFLSWAKKQINCGADAIWIDMLFKQATTLEKITGDPYHPAVKESYDAASKMVDEIHNYGYSEYGKYIYVGSWANSVTFPYSQPNLDFVTMTPDRMEVAQKTLDEDEWDYKINVIRDKFGDIKIFVFIDWAADNTPMAIFSQDLSTDEQKDFLNEMDVFSHQRGVVFIYPVHGGFMGYKATRLSYGKFSVYDSLAPEFQTYETIKELSQNKSITTTTTTTSTSTTITTTTIPTECSKKGDKPPCDGLVDDFELLEYIDRWAHNLVGDFDLLTAIDNWTKG